MLQHYQKRKMFAWYEYSDYFIHQSSIVIVAHIEKGFIKEHQTS
jgi:hypothetical protein